MFENVIMSDWARTNSDWKLLDYSQKTTEISPLSNMGIFDNASYIMYDFIYQRNSRQIESLWPSEQKFERNSRTFQLGSP